MDEEKKKGEETPETPASGEEKKPDVKEDEVDYKAEAEKLKKQLGQAEHTIVKLKTDKKKDDEEVPPVSIDPDAFKEEVLGEAKKEIEKFKADFAKDSVEEVLGSLTSNPDERELIRLNYENRIQRTGYDRQSILSDMKAAQILANGPKFEKRINEMKEKVLSDKAKNITGDTTSQDVSKKTTTLSDAEESFIKQQAKARGISEDIVRAKLIANKTK